MMTMVLVLKPGVKIAIRNLATLESMKDTYKPVICPRTKKCPVCKKAYKSSERLSNHMDVAHKIFTSKDSLRVHKANLHREKVVMCIARVVARVIAQVTVIPYTVIGATCISAMHVAYTVSVCYASFVAYFFRNFHLFQGKATDLIILIINTYLYICSLIGNDVLQNTNFG